MKKVIVIVLILLLGAILILWVYSIRKTESVPAMFLEDFEQAYAAEDMGMISALYDNSAVFRYGDLEISREQALPNADIFFQNNEFRVVAGGTTFGENKQIADGEFFIQLRIELFRDDNLLISITLDKSGQVLSMESQDPRFGSIFFGL